MGTDSGISALAPMGSDVNGSEFRLMLPVASTTAAAEEPNQKPSVGERTQHPDKRYTKGELIGQGAQKKVYKAFDDEMGLEVAWNEVPVAELRYSSEKEKDRIFSEIRVLKQLTHKSIISLYDWWTDEKTSCICFVTELFTDGTLRQFRRKHRNCDLGVIKRWAWQILQGLVYLHGHNPPIIHRDLKSDNIFVNGSSGTVKIGDLGFATMRAGLSMAMSVIGTPEFMAPELYEESYNEKVDVYGFGMILLELDTLEYPYSECKNAAQIFKKVTSGAPPAALEKVSCEELKSFISTCICHDPTKRPEARQLLKHPFFDCIRLSGGGLGAPVKSSAALSALGSTSQLSRDRGSYVELNVLSAGPACRPAIEAPSRNSIGRESSSGNHPSRLANSSGQVSSPRYSSDFDGPIIAGMQQKQQSSVRNSVDIYNNMNVAGQSSYIGHTSVPNSPFSSYLMPSPSYEEQTVTKDEDLDENEILFANTPTNRLEGSPPIDSNHHSVNGKTSPESGGQSHGGQHKEHSMSFGARSHPQHIVDHLREGAVSESGSDTESAHAPGMASSLRPDLSMRLNMNCHRTEDDGTLSFSLSFVNHSGVRRKVGFLYNLEEDQPIQIANEMVENLSLELDEAEFIASMIENKVRVQTHDQENTREPQGQLALQLKAQGLSPSQDLPSALGLPTQALEALPQETEKAMPRSSEGTPFPRRPSDGGDPSRLSSGPPPIVAQQQLISQQLGISASRELEDSEPEYEEDVPSCFF